MESQAKHEEIPVPEDFAPYVLAHEKVVRISTLPEGNVKLTPPSALRELYRLAQVKLRSQVGDFPPLASLASEVNSKVSSDENLHLYEALFGRDSLRVAIDTLPIFPRLARATIISLAELQGREFNAAREEEPGRIPHEVRAPNDPIARRLTEERGWQWPYYGSIDSTPEFIRTISAYCKYSSEGTSFLLQRYKNQSGDEQSISDSYVAAVDWMTDRMDLNQEGLLEFKTSIPGGLMSAGLPNQAWKDSPDAYFHEDGALANHSQGIASVEVQRVAYDALLDAAELYSTQLGRHSCAAELYARAKKLKKTVLDHFWTEDKGGYFVLGTDRDSNGSLRQLKIRTSNMGHLLNSGLLEGDEIEQYRRAIVRHLFSPPMLNVSGIRTLASDEKRFRPGAYHNGSVWLWDTHFIAKGLRHHGYHELSEVLMEKLFNVINTTQKFPEYVRGDTAAAPSMNTRCIDVWDEDYQYVNSVEQPPQEVQAWSVAAVVAMKYYRKQHKKKNHVHVSGSFERSIIDSLDLS